VVSLPAPLDMSTDQHHSHDGSEPSPRTTEEVATPTLTAFCCSLSSSVLPGSNGACGGTHNWAHEIAGRGNKSD
jgi:hypothetical protein